MNLSKTQLEKIIKEELEEAVLSYDKTTHLEEDVVGELGDKGSINVGVSPNDYNISFDWSRDGLTMWMFVDGVNVASFSTQKEIQSFINQLQGVLSGPMRASP